jgi:hypothetical protein
VVVEDPGQQPGQLVALVGGQRGEQLVLDLGQSLRQPAALASTGRGDGDDVAAPVRRIRGALDLWGLR